jgi:hypothetical protein
LTWDTLYDAFLNDIHGPIFVESLPTEQQARSERIGGFAGFHAAVLAFRVRQFHVVTGKIAMNTELVGNKLRQGDIRARKTPFEPKDLGSTKHF